MGLLEHRLVDEGAVGKLGEQALAHAEREVEFVHREVDAPELDVGLLEQLAADFARLVEDLLADAERLGVFEVGLLVEAELLVVVADLGQGGGGAELGLQAQFLVGNLGVRDPHVAEVALDDPRLGGADCGPSPRWCSSR